MTSTALPFWLDGQAPYGGVSPSAGHPFAPMPDAGYRKAMEVQNQFVFELLGADAAGSHYDAWIDLTRRALEPNVFFEPAFVLGAAQHFAMARKPKFLFAWQDSAAGRRLVGLCPLMLPRRGLPGRASIWRHDQSSSAVPLLDRTMAGAVLAGMLAHIGRLAPHVCALLLPRLAEQGPVAAALREIAPAMGRGLRVFDTHKRAILVRAAETAEPAPGGLSAKKLKDLKRLGRRLAGDAGLVVRSASSCCDVRQALEQFLALEARGWKGQRGSALLCDPGLAAFARSGLRQLAGEGKCRIDLLERGGVPIAAAIVLTSAGHAYYWKTTYDEAFAAFSPGVQLSLETSRLQLADAGTELTDSGAIEGHPMIDHMWRGRIAIADILIAIKPHSGIIFRALATREALTRSLRERAKKILHRLKGRKWS